jgi:cell wall-associated NlpC family hydrolase
MNTHVKRAILDHAAAIPHEEVCGFIYQDDTMVRAYPCANVSAEDKRETFEIASEDYLTVQGLGRICGIYHGGATHSNDAFSEEDLAMAREMCLPLHLCAASGKWATYIPETYQLPEEGRMWAWGEADCLSTIALRYRQKRGIYITDYDRDETFAETAGDIIARHVADEGFSYVDKSAPILVDDVLLFRTRGSNAAQHMGVMVGPNQMLHHPLNQLSRIESLDGAWLRRIVGVLRYTGKAAT